MNIKTDGMKHNKFNDIIDIDSQLNSKENDDKDVYDD